MPKILSSIRYRSDFLTDIRKLSKMSGIPKDVIVEKALALSPYIQSLKTKYPGWEKSKVTPLNGQTDHDVRDRTKDGD